MKEYYIIQCTWRGKSCFMVWYSNDDDGVLTDNDRILIFGSLSSCEKYMNTNRINHKEVSEYLYDFDYFLRWPDDPESKTINSDLFINMLNLIKDMLSSINHASREDITFREIYDKIFWSNNLPAITPVGHKYKAKWSPEELDRLATSINDDIQTISNHVLMVD